MLWFDLFSRGEKTPGLGGRLNKEFPDDRLSSGHSCKIYLVTCYNLDPKMDINLQISQEIRKSPTALLNIFWLEREHSE